MRRILALHGKSSNNNITKLQLENLQITSDKYEIIYLHGPIHEENGAPDVEAFVDGPFYSWFYGQYTDGRFKPSLLKAVTMVWQTIQDLGPFDAIYGFSQGATVAALAGAAYLDTDLRNDILRQFASSVGRYSIIQSFFQGASNALSVDTFNEPPFEYMILACSVHTPADLAAALQLPLQSLEPRSVYIPSIHLIGSSDPRKANTEQMSGLFANVQVMYMGGGHAVTRFVEQDESLLHCIHEGIRLGDNPVTVDVPELRQVSAVSSVGVMSPLQVAVVKLDGLIADPTITNVLQAKPSDKALFFNARDDDVSRYTTYGDVLDFIQGGPGDLRRLGVKTGEVVAYGAPPGGGAVPALSFLSVMSQTTAAPLAPSTTESDALDLLEQFNAKHLILFEGVDCPGLESAFAKLAASGKAILHRARIRSSGGKPGMFDYTHSGSQELDSKWVPSSDTTLQNPVDGVALLLATSGTTSKPKGVPILHGSIVQNGNILASTMGLRETDVCYSVMPLFHIGGISASILCTIASGGSVCCDGGGYNPERMVDALALSRPQPTWYSSVPTIHNATVSFIREMAGESEKLQGYGVDKDGVWKSGHSLRMIRSGAAALLGPDAVNLGETYGSIPVYPTYSMSEQMPISQPPNGKDDMVIDKPGSVGVPVAASLAIVDSSTMRVLPHGREGEIAISGPTVIRNYLNNQEADKKAYFELSLPIHHSNEFQRGRYFLTGDVGFIDKEGFLSLKGRNKELIKKGGEQVSPFEIEEAIIDHPWIEIAVCFAVPSRMYGEEVGLALVLSNSAPMGVELNEVIKNMREYLKVGEVPALKWPSKWKIVQESDLPKTKSNKYIRVQAAKVLGFLDDDDEVDACPLKQAENKNNTFIDWDVISGFRFFLACYVMFMHIGGNESWGAFNNLRGWPWHVHVFFTLGGFSLVAPMNPVIKKKFKYFLARIGAMYPMYVVALIFGLINLLVVCRPSTFRPDFHWDAQPDDLYIGGDEANGTSELFCEGTPATPKSYWGSLILTLFVYLFGFAITPMWALSWWMGYYLWFSAMYYQCLMVFPSMYNGLFRWRSNTKRFLQLITGLLVVNYILLIVTWFSVKDANGYTHYDPETGNAQPVSEYNKDAFMHNAVVLGWYLFSPFWILYFVVGACTAFLYDAYRPTEKVNARYWGYVADGCSLVILIWSICLIAQGDNSYNFDKSFDLRPDEADNFTDAAATNRIWDNICGRLFAPLTTLWIFSLSTGEGWTAMLFRMPFLVETISPHSYNCFLFHQMVGQWYYAATRNGWWNWWQYRKTMYWFSPGPCPVEWYEYFYVVMLTVMFSSLMNVTAEPLMSAFISFLTSVIFGVPDSDDVDAEMALITAIEDMTGFAPELDWTLDQCGLSSVGLPQLAARLKKAFSSKAKPVSVSAAQLSNARTIGDIADVLESAMAQANADGI